jgi:iron complex outermembrane recepter protein
MNYYYMKAFIGFVAGIALSYIASSQESKSDSIFSKTLSPVNIYALKGKHPDHRTSLTNGDWVQHDAGQVLQQIPGFSAIRKSGNFGFDPVFRGFRSEQLSIVNDGALTAMAACPNRMDPPTSQVMINQVQEIEILKGPHNFRYGPASGAVINFKTSDPVFSATTQYYGRINAGGESNGDILRSEGMIGIRTDKLQLALAGSYSNGDDYKDGNDSIIPAKFNRGAVNINASYKVKPDHTATVNISRNFARNTSFPTLGMDLLSDDTWMMQAGYNIRSQSRWYSQWNTQLYTSMVDHSMGNELRPTYKIMKMLSIADTRVSGGRTEFLIRKNGINMYVGGDVKYEYANGERTREMTTGMMAGKLFRDTLWQQGSILRTGMFAHAVKKAGKYELSFSGRLDLVQAKPQAAANKFSNTYDDLSRTDLNPSLSAGVSRSFSSSFQAGMWLGRGVRSAGLSEKYINFLAIGQDAYEVVGDPQLRPEVNTQLDLMARFNKEGTLLQFNGYASKLSDYITTVVDPSLKPVLATSPGVRRYVNVDNATMLGFEFNWMQKFGKQFGHELSAAYVWGENNELNEPLAEINPFEIRYRLNASVLKNLLQPYAGFRHAFEQSRVSSTFKEKETAAFTTVDLGLKVLPLEKLQISLAVQNVFNVAYREHLSRYIRPTLPLNSPGRNVVLMAAFSF